MPRPEGPPDDTEELTLTAELLLLAIDPARGGLVPHRRRRFNRALRVTHRSGGGARRWPAEARRAAVRELRRAGLVEPQRELGRGPRLSDRAGTAARLNRLRRCIDENDFPEPRDVELALLLAWSGVLARRLSKDDRRIAARRLRKLGRSMELGLSQAPLTGMVADPEWIGGLGEGAYYMQRELLQDVVTDFVTGSDGGLDAMGFAGGGGDGGLGFDGGGGGGDGGGGGGGGGGSGQ